MTRYYEACATCFNWEIPVRGDSGKLYKIRYGKGNHKFENGRDYSCTCKAYEYREGYCKHIVRKQRFHCNWREPLAKPELHYLRCPQCGMATRLETVEEEDGDIGSQVGGAAEIESSDDMDTQE